jgi:hypothetical protein
MPLSSLSQEEDVIVEEDESERTEELLEREERHDIRFVTGDVACPQVQSRLPYTHANRKRRSKACVCMYVCVTRKREAVLLIGHQRARRRSASSRRAWMTRGAGEPAASSLRSLQSPPSRSRCLSSLPAYKLFMIQLFRCMTIADVRASWRDEGPPTGASAPGAAGRVALRRTHRSSEETKSAYLL